MHVGCHAPVASVAAIINLLAPRGNEGTTSVHLLTQLVSATESAWILQLAPTEW